VLALASSIQERVERAVAVAMRLAVTLHVGHADVDITDPRMWPSAVASFPACEQRSCRDALAFVADEGFDFASMGFVVHESGGKPN
jgi:hypothetical protein